MKIERSGKCFDISSLLSSHWIFLSEVLYMEWHWIRYCSRFCERERTMKFWGIKISMDCPFASLLVPVCQSWLSFVVLSNSEDHPDPNYRRNFSHTSPQMFHFSIFSAQQLEIEIQEIASMLIAFDRHHDWMSKEVKIRPKSGSMLLYSRKKVNLSFGFLVFTGSYFQVRYRRDGYCWKKRKDGKTTREDHMKLKVQGMEVTKHPTLP